MKNFKTTLSFILALAMVLLCVPTVSPIVQAEAAPLTLSGDLPAGVYTLKYEDETGIMENYADICSLEITEPGSDVSYRGFIEENYAPYGATCIGVYNALGDRVDELPLDSLVTPNLGEKAYSIGVLSDPHIGMVDSDTYLEQALTYYENNESIALTAICGDLSERGIDEELSLYKSITETYSSKPVYGITGNHDAGGSFAPLAMDALKPYTGQDLYYSFTQGDDVYIMMGMYSTRAGQEFAEGELEWLYQVLEENRNKRCFLFMHLYPKDGSGDAVDMDNAVDMLNNTQGEVFYSLLSHYKNVLYFHGHSHEKFQLQEVNSMNNYDNIFGCHSIHIPALTNAKTISAESTLIVDFTASEGYVVDVYENKVVLRGRDFISGKFLPIANYVLDTTLQDIPANTYYDPTGTIANENSNVLLSGNTWYKSAVEKSEITKITFADRYQATAFDESWDAGISGSGQVMVYRIGTELVIVGNDAGILANANSSEMFADFTALTEIVNLSVLNTSNITNLSGMFKNCSSMASVDLSGFRDAKPADMAEVFRGCSSLQTVDLSALDLASVSQYRSLFSGCSSLKNVIFPDDASAKASDVYGYAMFEDCSALEEMDLTVFTGKGLHMTDMYRDCSALKRVRFGQNRIIECVNAFYRCPSLEEVDISGLDFSNTTNTNAIFNGCSGLVSIAIPASMTSIGDSAFQGCDSLAKVYYCGTRQQWSAISIGENNEKLTEAELQFHNYIDGACVYCGQTAPTSYLHGSISHFGGPGSTVTLTLFEGEREVTSTVSTDGTYSFDAIPYGTYTLQATKNDLIIRSYEITVDSADITQDIQLYPLGDINIDGTVDSNDVIQLLLHISLPALFPIETTADFTGDGAVTSDDVIQLLLHISLPDLFPLG